MAFFDGLLLGTGVLTRVSSMAFYATMGGVVLLGDPTSGAIIALAHGLGRTAPLIAISWGAADYQCAFQRDQAARVWQPVVWLFNGLALSGSGGWLLGAVLARI